MADLSDLAQLVPAEAAHAPPIPAAADAWTVLCVDDEPNILAALRRLLRGSGYRVLSANSGAEALALMERESVDLVISDMRMPMMDGAQLLEQVCRRWPDTLRLLLTGYADMASTMAAINRGEVYRYITKPWHDQELLLTLRQAFERQALARDKRRLEALTRAQNDELKLLNASLETRVAERTQELSDANAKLKKTYMTTIRVFSNLIELRGGQLVGHSRRVADLVRRTAVAMNCDSESTQQIFIAALLHDIGQIGLSDELMACSVPRMSESDLTLYRKHPVLGEHALMALDDLQPAAQLIRAHHERHDGKGFPDKLAGDAIPLGARIIAIAEAYDDLQNGHLGAKLSPEQARLVIARARGTQFHPEVVDVFLQVCMDAAPSSAPPPLRRRTQELVPGMTLARELISKDGVVLLAHDHMLTADLIERIRRYEERDEVCLLHLINPPRRKP
jgi:response regulator RpfG family c-di-GMP phosphodiesterase